MEVIIEKNLWLKAVPDTATSVVSNAVNGTLKGFLIALIVLFRFKSACSELRLLQLKVGQRDHFDEMVFLRTIYITTTILDDRLLKGGLSIEIKVF